MGQRWINSKYPRKKSGKSFCSQCNTVEKKMLVSNRSSSKSMKKCSSFVHYSSAERRSTTSSSTNSKNIRQSPDTSTNFGTRNKFSHQRQNVISQHYIIHSTQTPQYQFQKFHILENLFDSRCWSMLVNSFGTFASRVNDNHLLMWGSMCQPKSIFKSNDFICGLRRSTFHKLRFLKWSMYPPLFGICLIVNSSKRGERVSMYFENITMNHKIWPPNNMSVNSNCVRSFVCVIPRNHVANCQRHFPGIQNKNTKCMQ